MRKPIFSHLLIPILFALFSFQCFYTIKTKSPVTDTIAFHAVNGYFYLKSHDFRMSPATPPLMREWVALPWLFLNLKTDYSDVSWGEADSVPFSMKFFYQDNRSRAELMLMLSRVMTWLVAVALFFLVRVWARQLYGHFGSLVASALYLCSPTIIGYSSVVNIDITIAFFYTLTSYCVWRQWEERAGNQKKHFWRIALSFAGALATKYTGILLSPLILIFSILRKGLLKGILASTMISVLAMGVVWSTYFFEFKPLLKNVPRIEEKETYIRSISNAVFFENQTAQEIALRAAHSLPIPLPTWILGFAGIARSHQDDYHHYFMGQWRDVQVPYHYFVSFATKATIPILLLLLLRAWMMLQTLFRSNRREELISLCLLLSPCILFVMTWFDTTGVGIRYLVPVFPLFFIWISGLTRTSSKSLRKIVLALLTAHIVIGISAFPNHFAYFNPLIGGSQNAYKVFRANDLEWGQELKNLAAWIQQNNIKSVKTFLFGTKDESFYGIPSTSMTDAEMEHPESKVYAISVFFLDSIKWSQQYQPVKKIGYTIWVYDFRNTGEI